MPPLELSIIIALLLTHFVLKRNAVRIATTLLLFLLIEYMIFFGGADLHSLVTEAHTDGRSKDYVDGLKAMSDRNASTKLHGGISVLGMTLIALFGRALERKRETAAGLRSLPKSTAPK